MPKFHYQHGAGHKVLQIENRVSVWHVTDTEWQSSPFTVVSSYPRQVTMKYLLVLVFTWTSAARLIHHHDIYLEEWKAFKLEHNKSYINEEKERVAMKVFAKNKYNVAKHNQLYERGEVSFRLGINKFSDMTLKQFARINGYRQTKRSMEDNFLEATYIKAANVMPPRSVDWRELGAVTEVKNQELCAACWSFSATGALEGQHFRKHGHLESLSEQNLIDCSYNSFNNNGCDGGNVENAFAYVNFIGGIDTEQNYPYEANQNKCRYNSTDSEVGDVGISYIPKGNEAELMMAVATIGPIAVAIDANHESFKGYTSDVYYEKNCSSKRLNHAVLVVGYGRDERHGDYWLVKNSYGRDWGEDGYMRLARNRGNHCGVATDATYPLV
ncbi:unnamed protein product, partial [Brenthis ino]